MSKWSTSLRVGAFTAVLGLTGVGIYLFIDQGRQSSEGYRVYALMDDATGVAKLSHVRTAGIPVGNVDKVSLSGLKARIDLRIHDDVVLYEDASVTKVSSSLLGEYYLRVYPGTEGKKKLKDGDQIQVIVEGTSTDDILREVNDIAKDVRKVSQALANSVGTQQGEQDMREILHNLAQMTESLNAAVHENRRDLRQIVQNVERITADGKPQVKEILQNVKETTHEAQVLMAKSDEPGVPSGEVRQVIEKLNRASDNLEKVMADAEVVSSRLEKGEGNLGRLSKDEHLINEVEGIAENVGDFVGGIGRLRTIVSLHSDYNILSSTMKTFVEVRLQPREDKYYSLEVVTDPRGNTSVEQVDVVSTNPNDPPQYREVRTVTTNKLRFSLQFAQRMGPFVGRFGIKESTGGIGLDTLLFNDRFELRQDLFGFGETSLPRYRVYLSYEFVSRLWLLGGVDDVFSNGRRDYFVGLQLRFDDQDLKSILPFAPSF